MIELRVNDAIPSENQVRKKEHWSIDHRRGKRFERDLLLDLLIQTKKKDRDKFLSRPKFAKLTIHSQRRRKITDLDNFHGGAKSFVDALKRLGLIFDDDVEHVEIIYTQATGSPYYTEVKIEANYE